MLQDLKAQRELITVGGMQEQGVMEEGTHRPHTHRPKEMQTGRRGEEEVDEETGAKNFLNWSM